MAQSHSHKSVKPYLFTPDAAGVQASAVYRSRLCNETAGLRAGAKGVEIVVAPRQIAHEALRFGSQREQALAELDRDDEVSLAVQDQDRGLHLTDALVRMVLVVHQPPHRDDGK